MRKIFFHIQKDHKKFSKLRRHIHANPELAFNETETAKIVAAEMKAYGIAVTQGVGKTGVVGTLTHGVSSKSIGFRADMDALPMQELNTFSYRSRNDNCMHGCGHDGHTATLLSAAKYLAETKNFDGTIQFVFQPAEEANKLGSGAKSMINDGLFQRFPMDAIFAFHNLPGLEAGAVATRAGPILASMDLFHVEVKAAGAHAAFPNQGNDPIVIGAALINAWQTIISRHIGSQEQAVISVTSVMTGDSFGVIPSNICLKGSIRTLDKETQRKIQKRFVSMTESIVNGYGASVRIDYENSCPVLVNSSTETDLVYQAASRVTDEFQLVKNAAAKMGSDDFSFMLQEKPGCYFWIGNDAISSRSTSEESAIDRQEVLAPCMLHEPNYDFNDTIIPIGASIFSSLAEDILAADK